jgi:hypothetical protein
MASGGGEGLVTWPRLSAVVAVALVLALLYAPGNSNLAGAPSFSFPASYVPTSGPSPAIGGPGLSAPIAAAAPINSTAITVTWTASTGTVTNYSVTYARFYGIPIASESAGVKLVYNVTGLGFGLTYYFTIHAWNNTTEGPPSNIAAAQTDVPIPPQTPFPWDTITAVTMLSILGSLAFSAVVASVVAGRRSRRAEGAAAVALARTAPRGREGEIRAPRQRRPPSAS